ncbi:MAG: secretion system protein [Chloroflexi bacterium]|nr:secretion system protein [Chloroflexota bacterium]
MDMNPILILGIGGGLALLLLIVGIVVSARSERTSVDERIDRYVSQEEQAEIRKAAATPLTDWITRRVDKSSYGDKISRDLAQANLKIKTGEYIAIMIIAVFLMAVLMYVIGGKSLLLAAVGAFIGFLLPGMYVKGEQKKRLHKFNDQLSDMLNLMVNSLRAGFSTMQAMEAVSKELPAPICDEFRRVVQEMQLGIPMERALDNLLTRIPSDDLDLVITAINVQREVGGNLAEILDTISYTIRERVRIKGEIRVLTSQVIYSGRFLSMLPVILMLLLYVMNRDYMMTFFRPESGMCGYISLGVSAVLIIIGYFVMTKIADIEV